MLTGYTSLFSVLHAAGSFQCCLLARSCRLPTCSYRFTTPSCRLSTRSCSLSTCSCRFTTPSCRLSTRSCRLPTCLCLLGVGKGVPRKMPLPIHLAGSQRLLAGYEHVHAGCQRVHVRCIVTALTPARQKCYAFS